MSLKLSQWVFGREFGELKLIIHLGACLVFLQVIRRRDSLGLPPEFGRQTTRHIVLGLFQCQTLTRPLKYTV